MTITFWGVRGSIPVPGTSTSHYGGNTPCLSISLDDGHTLILDAGTGLRQIPFPEEDGGHTYFFLISHPHWDHIQGFPFFRPRSRTTARIVFLHEDGGVMAANVLSQMDGVHFPVHRRQVEAEIVAHVADRNELLRPFGLTVTEIPLHHPGGAKGFLIENGASRLLYMSDNELGTGFDPSSIPDPHAGFELLIHDAQYTDEELASHRGWGHSSMWGALQLALDLRCRSLALFHHDPMRSDEELSRLENQLQHEAAGRLNILAAREGMTLDW